MLPGKWNKKFSGFPHPIAKILERLAAQLARRAAGTRPIRVLAAVCMLVSGLIDPMATCRRLHMSRKVFRSSQGDFKPRPVWKQIVSVSAILLSFSELQHEAGNTA